MGPVRGSHKCKVQQVPHCNKSDSPDDSVTIWCDQDFAGSRVVWGRDLDSASVPGCENAATVGASGTVDNASDYGRFGMQPFLFL